MAKYYALGFPTKDCYSSVSSAFQLDPSLNSTIIGNGTAVHLNGSVIAIYDGTLPLFGFITQIDPVVTGAVNSRCVTVCRTAETFSAPCTGSISDGDGISVNSSGKIVAGDTWVAESSSIDMIDHNDGTVKKGVFFSFDARAGSPAVALATASVQKTTESYKKNELKTESKKFEPNVVEGGNK